jgi:hypothetical protein
LRRLHLIEIHDQPWLPTSLRDALTDTLEHIFGVTNLYAAAVPRLRRALDRADTNQIVDLCSGAGGPWLWMCPHFAGQTFSLDVWLTDKYPNHAASERVQKLNGNGLRYFVKSVDARNIPRELQRFRTMFTSFHHFPPEEARAVLQEAVDHRQGIAVFEVPRRSILTIFGCLFIPIITLLAGPFIRPFRWSRLFWTYLLPVAPIILCLDGIVSCLRAYSETELSELIRPLSASGYQWEIGHEHVGRCCLRMTYLIGYLETPV